MTPKELFKKAAYYRQKHELWNNKLIAWFRADCPTTTISHPNGKITLKYDKTVLDKAKSRKSKNNKG